MVLRGEGVEEEGGLRPRLPRQCSSGGGARTPASVAGRGGGGARSIAIVWFPAALALASAFAHLLTPPHTGGEGELLPCVVIVVLRRWRERAGAVGGAGWSKEASLSSPALRAGRVEAGARFCFCCCCCCCCGRCTGVGGSAGGGSRAEEDVGFFWCWFRCCWSASSSSVMSCFLGWKKEREERGEFFRFSSSPSLPLSENIETNLPHALVARGRGRDGQGVALEADLGAVVESLRERERVFVCGF